MTLEVLGMELVMDSATLAGLAVVAASTLLISVLGRRRRVPVPVPVRRQRRH